MRDIQSDVNIVDHAVFVEIHYDSVRAKLHEDSPLFFFCLALRIPLVGLLQTPSDLPVAVRLPFVDPQVLLTKL